jgi:hypothetical protein
MRRRSAALETAGPGLAGRPETSTQDTPAEAHPRRSLAPIVFGAGAVVLLGGALGLSLWGDSTYDAANAEMIDQARRDSLYQSANYQRYAAEGRAVAGVGCAGVAVWRTLLDPPPGVGDGATPECPSGGLI